MTQDITQIKQHSIIQNTKLRLISHASFQSSKELFQKFLDEIEALTESDIGFFHFIDENQKILNLQMWSTNTIKNMCTAGVVSEHYPISEAGVWANSFREGRPVIYNDYQALSQKKEMPPGHAPVDRILSVPVFRQEKIVAILGVGNKKTDYTSQDVEIVQQLADLVWETVSLNKANEALAHSERRFRTLFERAPIGIDIVSPEGVPIHVNQTLIDLLGYTREELCANPFITWIHPEDIESSMALVRELGEGKTERLSLEKRYIHKKGMVLWAKTDVIAVRKETGDVDYFLAMVQDITEQKNYHDSLQESEAALKQAQKMAGVGNWQWDIVKNRHIWSEEIYHIYGRDTHLSPAVYPEVKKYFTPESWAGLSENVEKALADGVSYEYDAEVVRPDGVHRWITARGEAHRGENGDIVLLRGTVQDITDRKKSETALRESEERFKFLSEATLERIHIHDKGVVLDANTSFAKMLGYESVDEITGQVIMARHLTQESLKKVQKNIDTGYQGAYEVVGVRCDGTHLPVEIISRNIEYHGKAVRAIAARDITERKSAERLLKWNVRRNELLSETASRLLHSDDPTTLIEDICWRVATFIHCQVFINFLYFPDEKQLHLNAWGGIPDEKISEIDPIDYGADTNSGDIQDAYEGSCGDIRHISHRMVLFLKSLGIQTYCSFPLVIEDRLLGTLLFGKHVKSEFWKEEIEIMRSIANLVAMAVNRLKSEKEQISLEHQLRQSQKVEAIGRLAGSVAHDFNNILTGIKGFTKFALEDVKTGTEIHENLTEVVQLADRAADLTHQLLAFSRKQQLQKKILDLNILVKDYLKMIHRLLREDIAINYQSAEKLYKVRADPGQIGQVLLNLSVNARDAMPHGGTLTIELMNGVVTRETTTPHRISHRADMFLSP